MTTLTFYGGVGEIGGNNSCYYVFFDETLSREIVSFFVPRNDTIVSFSAIRVILI